MKVAVLVNFSANHFKAEEKWHFIESAVMRQLPGNTHLITYSIPFDLDNCLKPLITGNGIDCIISAGGDGSVNFILNYIFQNFADQAVNIHLGAIGLGSSNDFLKPFGKEISGIPLKIDINSSRPMDIGKVMYTDPDGKKTTKYFIANASLGVTAEANLLFNREDMFLKWLKPRLVSMAILYSAVKTIATYRNIPVKLAYREKREQIMLTNISVVKNPNISGSFRYDQEIAPDDGRLGLNYCYGMNRMKLLRILYDLQKGRFSGKPGRVSEFIDHLRIDTEKYIALETDGEVSMAKEIEFSILPGAINVIGS